VTSPLKPPCAFQGGKQRISKQIVEVLLEAAANEETKFYDLCCGSGAISLELVNRGVNPSRIFMLDNSSWGSFWSSIGEGRFNLDYFEKLLSDLPNDKTKIKSHISELATKPVGINEDELYILLQSCSFGGKQIWRKEDEWANAFFRDYWQPTEASVRRSAANPIQPGPSELLKRLERIVERMRGVKAIHADISTIFDTDIAKNAVVYVDPPYAGTTGYGFNFDSTEFASQYQAEHSSPLFISEARPLSTNSVKLYFGGANGGISATRRIKHEEWLSRF